MSSSGDANMGPPSSSGTRITRRVSVLKKLRNSFRRKKESYCISCGHVTRNCCHHSDVYENVEFNQKDDLLKWLDLDLSHSTSALSALILEASDPDCVISSVGELGLGPEETRCWRTAQQYSTTSSEG